MRRIFLSLVLVAALPMMCGGCASLSLAALGTALGAAGSAASSGSAVYHLGKLDDVFMTDAAHVRLAVVLTSADLRMRFVGDHRKDPNKPIWVLQLIDDQDAGVVVTVEQRTPRLCRCRIDVGLFGSEPTSQLFLDRLRTHLPSAAAAAAARGATRPSAD